MTAKINTSVLFVCTGNIFRSMTAEYALKHALPPESAIHVHSAGLVDAPHPIVPFVSDFLQQRGIDVSAHQPRKLTTSIVRNSDLVVAMDFVHREAVAEQFGISIPLFSEVATGAESAMLDVHEVVADWQNNEAAAREYGHTLMSGIFAAMPGFQQRLPLYVGKPAV